MDFESRCLELKLVSKTVNGDNSIDALPLHLANVNQYAAIVAMVCNQPAFNIFISKYSIIMNICIHNYEAHLMQNPAHLLFLGSNNWILLYHQCNECAAFSFCCHTMNANEKKIQLKIVGCVSHSLCVFMRERMKRPNANDSKTRKIDLLNEMNKRYLETTWDLMVETIPTMSSSWRNEHA